MGLEEQSRADNLFIPQYNDLESLRTIIPALSEYSANAIQAAALGMGLQDGLDLLGGTWRR